MSDGYYFSQVPLDVALTANSKVNDRRRWGFDADQKAALDKKISSLGYFQERDAENSRLKDENSLLHKKLQEYMAWRDEWVREQDRLTQSGMSAVYDRHMSK